MKYKPGFYIELLYTMFENYNSFQTLITVRRPRRRPTNRQTDRLMRGMRGDNDVWGCNLFVARLRGTTSMSFVWGNFTSNL
jgi:hypothetical protein